MLQLLNHSNYSLCYFPSSTPILFVGRQEGHLTRKKLGIGLLVVDLTGALHVLRLQLSLPLPLSLVPVKLAKPGSLGKWLLKWRDIYAMAAYLSMATVITIYTQMEIEPASR